MKASDANVNYLFVYEVYKTVLFFLSHLLE